MPLSLRSRMPISPAETARRLSEALAQEVEEHPHLRDLLRARLEHGVGRRLFGMVLVDKQPHQLLGAYRPSHHVVAEPGDAGALQGQFEDAFEFVAGKGVELEPPDGNPRSTSAITKCHAFACAGISTLTEKSRHILRRYNFDINV